MFLSRIWTELIGRCALFNTGRFYQSRGFYFLEYTYSRNNLLMLDYMLNINQNVEVIVWIEYYLMQDRECCLLLSVNHTNGD